MNEDTSCHNHAPCAVECKCFNIKHRLLHWRHFWDDYVVDTWKWGWIWERAIVVVSVGLFTFWVLGLAGIVVKLIWFGGFK